MIIVLDFDGTCVTHEFPEVGKDIGASPVLKRLVRNGHKIILFTMRNNVTNPYTKAPDRDIITEAGNYLDDAVNWFKQKNIPLWGIQTNPEQESWTSSPKAYGHLYIDDAGLGMPLIQNSLSKKPYVDWSTVEQMLIKKGYL